MAFLRLLLLAWLRPKVLPVAVLAWLRVVLPVELLAWLRVVLPVELLAWLRVGLPVALLAWLLLVLSPAVESARRSPRPQRERPGLSPRPS
jgi:hypothetical protein